MQLSMALVPPGDLLDEVHDRVLAVKGVAEQLAVRPAAAMRIPIAGLGNLTKPDALALCAELSRPLAELAASATVRLAGCSALEPAGDPGVAVPLVGDVDGVFRITSALAPAVAQHGFYVDRRRFVPRLEVAQVTRATSLPVLERLVADLERFESRPWEVAEVQILSRVHTDDGVFYELVDSLATTGRERPVTGER